MTRPNYRKAIDRRLAKIREENEKRTAEWKARVEDKTGKFFVQGQCVATPMGTGSVCYVRNGPPDYKKVFQVSVLLDSRRGEAITGNYKGTVFHVSDVEPFSRTEPRKAGRS